MQGKYWHSVIGNDVERENWKLRMGQNAQIEKPIWNLKVRQKCNSQTTFKMHLIAIYWKHEIGLKVFYFPQVFDHLDLHLIGFLLCTSCSLFDDGMQKIKFRSETKWGAKSLEKRKQNLWHKNCRETKWETERGPNFRARWAKHPLPLPCLLFKPICP